jgi:hypothetical protein
VRPAIDTDERGGAQREEELSVQKIGAQYLVKKFTDYVTAPPAEAPEQEPGMPAATALPDLDGQVIEDDEGQPIGTAHRLRDVAVYVVSRGYGDRAEELRECIGDPESRVLFHTVDGRLAGLIYVPDPSKAPRQAAGMRADEV